MKEKTDEQKQSVGTKLSLYNYIASENSCLHLAKFPNQTNIYHQHIYNSSGDESLSSINCV